MVNFGKGAAGRGGFGLGLVGRGPLGHGVVKKYFLATLFRRKGAFYIETK